MYLQDCSFHSIEWGHIVPPYSNQICRLRILPAPGEGVRCYLTPNLSPNGKGRFFDQGLKHQRGYERKFMDAMRSVYKLQPLRDLHRFSSDQLHKFVINISVAGLANQEKG